MIQAAGDDAAGGITRRTECLQIDALGNKTTPLLTVAEAYYSRKMDTYVYCILSSASRTASLYLWNPRYGAKGQNAVLSLQHHHHTTNPSGAHVLNVWADRCGAQANNWATIMYNIYISDPAMGCHVHDEINQKYPESGHSYNGCDRAAGIIEMAQRKSGKVRETLDDWAELMAEANKTHPNRVYKFTDQKTHRRWVKPQKQSDGASAAAGPGFLDQFYSRTASVLKHGRVAVDPAKCGPQDAHTEVKVNMMAYRWRNFGAGLDSDGQYKLHPGVVWLRKGVTHCDASGKVEPWVKLDLRSYENTGEGSKPITPASDGVCADVMDEQFDLYDGLIKQPAAKDNDCWNLSKHCRCRCAGAGQCAEKASGELPCKYFGQPHLYPGLRKELRKAQDRAAAARMEEDLSDGESEDDDDSGERAALRALDEDEQSLLDHPDMPLQEATKILLRNQVQAEVWADKAYGTGPIARADVEGETAGLRDQ